MSKRKLPSIEAVIDDYINKKLNLAQICDKYGLSKGSKGNISIMLKKNGVKIRKDAGENHHNWKGGIISKGDGYIGIWKPEHSRADKQGYVYEHTLIYEKEKGILPSKNEVIHHIDMDKHNNSIDNLYLCNNKEHAQTHRSLEKIVRDLIERDIIEFQNGKYILK